MGEFFRMDNPIQHYAWGSRSVLAAMQGRSAPARRPEAELWVGAHPSASSTVVLGQRSRSLAELRPELPFLLKILAIGSPLSIQVHPSAEQARHGFARETESGIPPDAPERNYKDERAKPETVVALTGMWLLAGEQAPQVLRELARELDLAWLSRVARDPAPLRAALSLSAADAAAAVAACGAAAARARALQPQELPATAGDVTALAPEATALARAVCLIELLDRHHPGDPGVLVALCMNMVHLRPGHTLHTPARQLHAYLSGTAVEVMGCSDNVLRAGLTHKHVDVPELLAVMRRQQSPVDVREPGVGTDGWASYPLWDTSLGLHALHLRPHRNPRRTLGDGSVVLVTDGTVTARAGDTHALEITAGESALYLGDPATVEFSGEGLAFTVTHGSHP